MTGRVGRGHPRGMSSADHTLVSVRSSRSVGAHRRTGDAHRVRTTQRWTVASLVLATVVLLAYVALLVTTAWLFVSAWDAVAGRETAPIDVLGVATDLAPVLLVGWCTGFATSAVLARGEALGPRTAGLVAGSTGAAAGTVVLALTDLL